MADMEATRSERKGGRIGERARRLFDRIREFFLLENGERESERQTPLERAAVYQRVDAALERMQAARLLRESGLHVGALILFRDAGLLLAQAFLVSKDASLDAATLDARATFEKLDAAAPAWARRSPFLEDAGDVDRLPPREAAARAEELDAATRQLADLVEPRSPRQIRATRALRWTVLGLVVVGIVAAREIWLRTPVNLALNRPATASSEDLGTTPAGAVDDHRYGTYAFHSKQEDDPWLAVDLGRTYMITDAEVWGRHDCCYDQSMPLDFQISDDGRSYRTVATRTAPFEPLEPWIVKPVDLTGRYVRVKRKGRGYLVLTELVVYGHKPR